MVKLTIAVVKNILGIGVAGNTTHDLTVAVHPLKKVLLNLREKERNGKNAHPREDAGEVFHQTTHRHTPTGVGNVMQK